MNYYSNKTCMVILLVVSANYLFPMEKQIKDDAYLRSAVDSLFSEKLKEKIFKAAQKSARNRAIICAAYEKAKAKGGS